jgi:hypothetical protein
MMEFFLLVIAFRLALGPTLSPIQRVLGTLSLVIKRPKREADHPAPSSSEVKNVTSTSPVTVHGVVLNEAMDSSSWRGTYLSAGTILTLSVFHNT